MAAILHLQVGVGPKKIIKSNDMNAIGVLLSVLMATGTFLQLCSHLKIQRGAFFQDGCHFALKFGLGHR